MMYPTFQLDFHLWIRESFITLYERVTLKAPPPPQTGSCPLCTIAEDDLKQKLQAFEQAQQATRDEAIAAALQRKEVALAPAPDGS